MIHALLGDKQVNPDVFYDKKIEKIEIDNNQLLIDFDDGIKITLFDDGQSCCEDRYMTCDDDLKSLEGSTLTKLEVKDGPDIEHDYDCHEQQFLEITTDKGFATIANHNVHNGFYDGFALAIGERK